jgi:hypothetical protein
LATANGRLNPVCRPGAPPGSPTPEFGKLKRLEGALADLGFVPTDESAVAAAKRAVWLPATGEARSGYSVLGELARFPYRRTSQRP